VKLNLTQMMKAKDESVASLTKGVEFLLKKNKVDYIKGTGSFASENEVKVDVSTALTLIDTTPSTNQFSPSFLTAAKPNFVGRTSLSRPAVKPLPSPASKSMRRKWSPPPAQLPCPKSPDA
jgi:hypothetical protein